MSMGFTQGAGRTLVESSMGGVNQEAQDGLSRSGLTIDMNDEMVDLYQSIFSHSSAAKQRSLLFLSHSEKEGTSTVVREFAYVCSLEFGKKTLLVDANFINPSQHTFFNIAPKYSWLDHMEECKISKKAVFRLSQTGLLIAPLANRLSSVSRRINSESGQHFFSNLKNYVDIVLMDSSPASVSADYIALSRIVDGVILVVEAEKTRWPVLKKLTSKINSQGGNVLGVVFNKRKHHIPNTIYDRL